MAMPDILTSKNFTTLVPAFRANLAERGRSAATIDSYGSDVRLFLQFMHTEQLTSEDLSAITLHTYRDFLQNDHGLRENSLRRKIIAIRQFFSFLTASEAIAANPFEKSIIPARDDTLHYELEGGKLNHLLAMLAKRTDTQSMRNIAIIHLLAFEGLKASELTALYWRDFLASRRGALLRISGSRQRTIDLQPASTNNLRHWRRCVQQHHPQCDDRLIFSGFKGPEGALPLSTLTRHGLKFILAQLAAQAQVTSLSPALLRHHATRHMLQQGKSIEDSMAHLGLKRTGNVRHHLAQLQQ